MVGNGIPVGNIRLADSWKANIRIRYPNQKFRISGLSSDPDSPPLVGNAMLGNICHTRILS
ncbi:unnamed protein product [Meloidogyne enterolobii]|uniref:Uncharacterized protein n=1 Tax=Meloidogyne enterolobii TaxID=390850 RepID=A0ACB1AFL4_MELEN